MRRASPQAKTRVTTAPRRKKWKKDGWKKIPLAIRNSFRMGRYGWCLQVTGIQSMFVFELQLWSQCFGKNNLFSLFFWLYYCSWFQNHTFFAAEMANKEKYLKCCQNIANCKVFRLDLGYLKVFRPITHYRFFFDLVLGFWGSFFIVYLGCKKNWQPS